MSLSLSGRARGKCHETGCAGYVQQRGAPRSIKPRQSADGSTVESGVWSWNRVDHLVCRRCGAPSQLHEDLTEELARRNRRATANGALPKDPDRKKYQENAASRSNDDDDATRLGSKGRHHVFQTSFSQSLSLSLSLSLYLSLS